MKKVIILAVFIFTAMSFVSINKVNERNEPPSEELQGWCYEYALNLTTDYAEFGAIYDDCIGI